VQQHPEGLAGTAVIFQILSNLAAGFTFGIFPKNNFGTGTKFKVLHGRNNMPQIPV
jgi:hypothetical protein